MKNIKLLVLLVLFLLCLNVVISWDIKASDTRYEYYNANYESSDIIYNTTWFAQTFIIGTVGPNTSHFITSVKLRLYRDGLPGTVTVSIKEVDGNEKPTGEDLSIGTTNGNTLTTDYDNGEWREITMSPYPLLANTKYAIVVKALSGSAQKVIGWMYGYYTDYYPGGALYQSGDSGVNWYEYVEADALFEEYGISIPQPVENFTALAYNRTQINLTWTKGTYADGTRILRKIGSYPSSPDEDTAIYNSSGILFNDSNLIPNTAYYYRAWSWNDTYGFSDYRNAYNTTIADVLPEFNNCTIYPTFGYTEIQQFIFNVSIQDTDDANLSQTRIQVWSGTTYNESMTWVSGANLSGANYTKTLEPFVSSGLYNYQFQAYDGFYWNESTVYQFTVEMNSSFEINFPIYLEVGDYLLAYGTLKNVTGAPLDGIWITTKIYDPFGWTVVSQSELDFYVVNGFYQYCFSTSNMLTGIYYINVSYNYSGTWFYCNSTLYLSVGGGPGHKATTVHFTFYNSNTGIGIPIESLKLYVNNDPTTLTRAYGEFYDTYTGEILYYNVTDYFDNQIYPLVGTYQPIAITVVNQFIDIPINWYDLAIKNLNDTIMYFSMTSSARTYSITLFPMDSVHINVLPGTYNIIKNYYSAYTGSFLETESDTITITSDAFYISTGYNAVVHISWYNTNEGLGLPEETLKLYIDGVRKISKTHYTYINQTINVTVKDYYNLTLYTGNFTLSNTYTFLDFGLTFHSYKFNNLNNQYYMISFLREGGSRWFERGICPYETVEFLLPSGNYSLRIYDADNVTLYDNSSIQMVNSKLYVLNGSYLELVINGQSVIVGQLLELSSELYQATMPDLVKVVYSIPSIYSVFDRIGAIIGTKLVCPAIFTIAKTINETNINSTVSYPLVPVSDTNNGTITIRTDRIYFGGNASAVHWVNISYGSVNTNYSYLPDHIDLFGENVTVECNTNITLKRETIYQQIKKFYWTKYTDTNFYTATVGVENPFISVNLTEVYVYIEFANDTTPDYVTATCYDVSNGVYLTRGENFDVTASGIHFYLNSIPYNTTRRFTCNYYATVRPTTSSDAIISVDSRDLQRYNDKNYWHARAQYVNMGNTVFVGSLIIKFNFSDTDIIAPYSLVIYDNDRSCYLFSDEFAYLGSGLSIKQSIVGSVQPNGARTFDIYWLTTETEKEDVAKETENTIKNILSMQIVFGIPLFYIICAIMGIGAAVIARSAWKKHKSVNNWQKDAWLAFLIIFVLFVFWIWFNNI